MKLKKLFVVGAFVVLAVALAATASSLFWVCRKVRAFEAQHGGDVFANLSKAQVEGPSKPETPAPAQKDAAKNQYVVKEGDDLVDIAILQGVSEQAIREANNLTDDALKPGTVLVIPDAETSAAAAVDAAVAEKKADEKKPDEKKADEKKKEEPKGPPQMAVLRTEYDGERTLKVFLAERPDMGVIRSYVTVEPLAPDVVLSFSDESRFNFNTKRNDSVLRIVGDFAHRTNLTLRVRAGLPLFGKGANPGAEGALKSDYVYGFRRRDVQPFVAYAAEGRYLPPGGARAVAVESINVTNIHVEVSRVEPRNVVQLLARDEGVYNRYDWDSSVDKKDTEELAGEAEETVIACANKPNERESHLVTVAMKDGGPSNGIYLVAIRRADQPRQDWSWRDDGNPNRYRLVCLSDLGLSARMNGTDSPGVWVTSLTNGRPVAGARITVYSKSNTKVMEGVTDEKGWCHPARVAKGEPFAVVAVSPAGDDSTFMALRSSMAVDEMNPEGARPEYLAAGEVEAFLWTERGIYRHGEKIMLHALVRDGRRRAPSSIPVELRLTSPKGDVFASVTKTTDVAGSIAFDEFSVPDEQPSGDWLLEAKVPGKDGRILGSRSVKVEEFAPPQIRVAVSADATAHPSNFAFKVSAEHLFGGPAHALACEGVIVFDDVPFAPANWKGWKFGNSARGLESTFRRLAASSLDRDGVCSFDAPLWADSGLPAAAVRATAQGVVFEDGGRPATTRKSYDLHYYPYYIGSTLAEWVRREPGSRLKVRLACVRPDGTRLPESRRLVAKLERIETVYSYRTGANGWQTWDSTRIRKLVADAIPVVTSAGEDTFVEIPAVDCGDYAFEVTDPETKASFGATFYLSDWGDETVSAPLSDPTAVTLTLDKPFYRVGETPRLRVRSPFTGAALLSVMREKEVYSEVRDLANATDEIVLRPVTADDAPNLDVYISVVQSVEANAKHLAVRAHGQATVRVRPVEDEIPVAVTESAVTFGAGESGADVRVAFAAPGATAAIVTVVDEGINLLTDEATPDPVACFAAAREAEHPLYDLYHRILPVLGADNLRVSGVKTGGGDSADMLGRVSPVPSRRFRPLALWSAPLAVGADGRGEWKVRLPEFVGEVRVTVVAWSASATGAASTQSKVTPKVVAMPDAPRFAAPGDSFEVTLPIYLKVESEKLKAENGGAAEVLYSIAAAGKEVASGRVALAADGHTNVVARVTAPDAPGEFALVYRVRGLGESHEQTILLPVRPAVAWVETAGVSRVGEHQAPATNAFTRYWAKEFDSPLGEYESALRWLADYPHGCLEQTSSRIFPLLGAGGILASVSPMGDDVVRAGVRRVESMVRANDFVMWPDCNYAPWDREVSLYAAHFLVEAEKSGYALNAGERERVLGFLKGWAMSKNTEESAYACHTLALAGRPEKDRMLRLYDASANLSLLARARLARAFAAIHDRSRAEALLSRAAAPSSVKETAFAVLALLEIDPEDARILPMIRYLNGRRDREHFSWGTTSENAHALLAIGAYFRHHPPKAGEKFVSWRKLTLPKPEEVKDEASGIAVTRRYLTPEGGVADLNALKCGEMLVVELALSAPDTRELSDLVIEDLFPACFEPIHQSLPVEARKSGDETSDDPDAQASDKPAASSAWVMRSDARDDRMLVFSKKFTLKKGEEVTFRYPMRVVSSGEYVLPGPSVEAMYYPALHARRAPGRVVIRR